MSLIICLQEFVEEFTFSDGLGIKFKTDKGKIVFWGEHGELNENIEALRKQELPVMIELVDPAACKAPYYKSGYSWSVPSSEHVIINNDC